MKTTLLLFFMIAFIFGMGISQTKDSTTKREALVLVQEDLQKSSNDAPLEAILLTTFLIGGVLGYREFKDS